ncbi:MAG TPA: type VI secretion system-associated FHA domain protein TagH [Steroidobacteraceae bacterium]|jgi:type VI secretion system protein|nr:type VI secretion system-associated FHA domain protein TagH [Steroidobacteraceae bacterium]
MALRLRVVSEHSTRLGALTTKVFGVHGGSIGRATDNEWILPDPERYLSGKHARIDFRAGAYILTDTSSNGTYVNGAQVPLGKFHEYGLRDGDYVRLGEYELLVSIDQSNDFPPEESAIVAYDGQAPSSAARKSTANDLGADLDLSQLLEPSNLSAADSGVRPRDAYGQSLPPVDHPPGPADAAGTPWHMMTRPLKVESARVTPPTASAPIAPPSPPLSRSQSLPPLYEGDFDIGLSAFCRGAGIDPRSITTEARSTALQLAGQLLREAVLGLMDLNQGRNDFRNKFRISPPSAEAPESPLNLAKGVDEALVKLLTTTSTRAGSVEALRENFRELKAQNGATLAATRAAFEEFLNRVDPKELEERFERAGKRGVFGGQSKAKYWDLYAELFSGLAQRPPDGFPHLFIETFAKAYEAKLRALVPPRRTGFGEREEPGNPNSHAVGDL